MMEISNVVAFMAEWEEVCENFPDEMDEIRRVLGSFRDGVFLNYESFVEVRKRFESRLLKLGWTPMDRSYSSLGANVSFSVLGVRKNGISVTFGGILDPLGRWLFQRSGLAVKNGIVKMPLMILPSIKMGRGGGSSFEAILRQLRAISPLAHNAPFIILGVSAGGVVKPEVFEISSYYESGSRIFESAIEFPPEYHQAGMGILTFFGTYLSERYPQTDAKVRIEQVGMKVRLIIEGKDGAKDVVEKALQEYELIVSQKELPREVENNHKLVLELRQELRIAELRVESHRDMMAIQNATIGRLSTLLSESLQRNSVVNVDFSPCIRIDNVQSSNFLSGTIGALESLGDLVPPMSDAALQLDELQQDFGVMDAKSTPDEAKKSGVIDRLKRFLDMANDASSGVGKVVQSTAEGVEALQNLAAKYNKLAEWCGLPVVPSFFLKDK